MKREGIGSGHELIVHADRGSPMVAHNVQNLLARLNVTVSHSRPRVSNDNPFSESQFKTLKHCGHFPERFGSFEHAEPFCREFFAWYNFGHRHSGLAMLTPAAVHDGRADEICAANQAALDRAYAAKPERFVRGRPNVRRPREEMWINEPRFPEQQKELAGSRSTP